MNQISSNLFSLQLFIANGLNGQKLAPAPEPVEKVSKIIVEQNQYTLQMEIIAQEKKQAKNIVTPKAVQHSDQLPQVQVHIQVPLAKEVIITVEDIVEVIIKTPRTLVLVLCFWVRVHYYFWDENN